MVSTPEIDGRIEAQRRNLDSLLQRFTEQHPDVAGARRLIRELEELKRREVADLRRAAINSPGAPATTSLAQQEMSRLLANAEVQVASLSARVGEYTSRYNRAREMMKTAPQIEAEFAQLNRDYDVNKKNYNDLVSRRESAALSGDLESAAGVADFRLIDPPRASPKPVAPNRLLLLPGALVAAIAAGMAMAFAISQLRPVFYDPRSLTDAVGLPLLGSVSLILSDADVTSRKTDLKKFVGAVGVLVLVFAVGMVVFYLLSGRAG
jgi:polysaccharide chain length determinant protein (PEP-CTERM system associated)